MYRNYYIQIQAAKLDGPNCTPFTSMYYIKADITERGVVGDGGEKLKFVMSGSMQSLGVNVCAPNDGPSGHKAVRFSLGFFGRLISRPMELFTQQFVQYGICW
jgi:hypothetical protein